MADPQSTGEQKTPRLARRAWPLLLLLLLLVPLLRLVAIQGGIYPLRIAGGSMAGAFFGPHFLVQCHDCGIVFHCGVEYVPASRLAVCPNCGFAENRLEPAARTSGRRVVIDRWAQWTRGPTAWQAVAFTSAQDPDYLVVKRLVARGSGRLEIRDGDIFVDGQIQQKTLDQLRQMCILVHDDRFRPIRTAGLPARWHGAKADSRWHATPTGYRHDASSRAPTPAIDWLEYTQWACWTNPAPPIARTGPAPIVDHYAYNQNVSRNGLHPVGDIMLRCKMTLRGIGRVVLRADDGTDRFQLELDYPEPRCRLRQNGRVVWRGRHTGYRQPWSIEFAVCDQRVLAAINGGNLLEQPFEPTALPSRRCAAPLALAAVGLPMEVESLQVYRDVYYLGPNGQRHWDAPQPLGADQWFALGDNVPVSADSRHTGPVNSDAIIGSVHTLPN